MNIDGLRHGWIIAVFVAAVAPAKTFTGCGVQLTYPDRWVVRLIDVKKNAPCAIGLRPPGWIRENARSPVDLGPWAITATLFDKEFDDAAHDAGFSRAEETTGPDGVISNYVKRGDWAIAVRQGFGPAHGFRTKCCEAVRGSTWGHGVARDGSVATRTSDVAVVGNSVRSVVFESAADERFSQVLTRLIRTLRFVHASD